MLFGLLWYVVFLFPSSVLNSVQSSHYLLEHRNYIPSIGLIIALAEVQPVTRLLSNRYAAIALILFFSFLNISHTDNFKDRLSFWRNAVKTSPRALLLIRTWALCTCLTTRKLNRSANFWGPWNLTARTSGTQNLGLIYMRQKLFDKAEAEYVKEILINPKYDKAYYNSGWIIIFRERWKAR